jgi:hypothetical protein
MVFLLPDRPTLTRYCSLRQAWIDRQISGRTAEFFLVPIATLSPFRCLLREPRFRKNIHHPLNALPQIL